MKKVIISVLILFSFNLNGQNRTIHVLVALCDNINQGIVPVPSRIGNGQDPANNLYWGCGYGVKTFFKKQTNWKLIKQILSPSVDIYERLIFRHIISGAILVADAYNGAMIKNTITDFLNYAAGNKKICFQSDTLNIAVGSDANLICYVGHDGLMDFSLDNYPVKADLKKREVIILACASKNYFKEHIKRAGAYPLLWTTNLMCPEAYTLQAAIEEWINKATPEEIREKAAQTYNKFQKCGIKGARNLLVTGY